MTLCLNGELSDYMVKNLDQECENDTKLDIMRSWHLISHPRTTLMDRGRETAIAKMARAF